VDHSFLLLQLRKLGFPTIFVEWFAAFLLNRTQRISLTQHIHQALMLHLVSLLHINSLSSVMYADDVKIFRPLSSHDALLRNNIDCLCGLCSLNNVDLSADMCKFMSFCCKTLLSTSYSMNCLSDK